MSHLDQRINAPAFTGYAGRFGATGGLFFSSSITIWRESG